MAVFEQYEHHGVRVWVREDLRGRHREHCLCWKCSQFAPDDVDKNCNIAALLYRLCKLAKITTPVWECRDFQAF